MDGGVLLCQLVEGVGTVRARGRVSIFAVCLSNWLIIAYRGSEGGVVFLREW